MSEDPLEKASQDINESPTNEPLTLRESLPSSSHAAQPQEIKSAELTSVTLSAIRATLKQVDTQLHQLESQLHPRVELVPPALRHLPISQIWFFGLALLVVMLVVGVRLFKLNTIQTDLYGDIQIVYQYVQGVRSGSWPFEFVLGVGPLYQYLIMPVIMLTGLNYFGLKISAVIVSLGALLTTYTLARRLINDYFALLAVTIAGVSSWVLIFSRLGLSLILVPLLVSCAVWLMVRIAQDQRPSDVIACAVVSALGLYSYPQSFILPGISLITLVCLRWLGHPISWGDLRRFVIVSILSALPFAWIVYRWPQSFTQGYIGSKFFTEGNLPEALTHNIVAAALAYHVQGDSIFRSNPIYLPHLDRVSGLLFLAGVVFWLLPARRRWSPVLLVPFVLIHLPSVLVLGRPSEVPSAGRTLGAAPIAYILVASGLWWLGQSFAGKGRRWLGLAIAGSLLATILILNMQRYFGAYVSGLPYHDISIGERIALYADSLPPDTQVYVVGCCWEGAMPELPFVQLVATRSQNLHALDPGELTCDQLALLHGPTVLIWSFHNPVPAPQLTSCKQWLPAQLYMSPKGWPVFYAAPLVKDGG
jgi:4-amino-4-deoxy-L-arabinose transferase-like glycosyltransferase